MSLLFETISIRDGQIQNLPYHQQRLNRSRKELLDLNNELSLHECITIPPFYKSGRVKCRISYSDDIFSVSYNHYQARSINSIKLVYDDTICYDHKYENRSRLKMLYYTRQGHDEILIIKNGLVTDCFYYNVAFWDGTDWLTPKLPLLGGTMRAFLLVTGRIKEAEIHSSELSRFEKISLFNALNLFGSLELSTDQIN